MNRVFLLFVFLSASTIGSYAQYNTENDVDFSTVNDSIDDDTLFVPESWDTDLDSLMNAWHVKYYVDKNSHPGYEQAVVAGDEVYVERLSKMNNIIELPYNHVVRNCIDLYVDRRRTVVEYMLGLENIYFPMIEQILDANDLPHELKYLTVVESALNPTAFSRAGASGLWQFMTLTGKQYGLEVNSLVDERRDPLKSTHAAAAYLKDLYGMYGNWTLALAAYNCGPGNVNKAIRRANGSTDYWQIYPYLPKETRMYVPFFIAANYVMNYYANHRLHPVRTNLPVATDTVMVGQSIHFDQIAAVLNMDKKLIRMLNPQYKRDIVPGNSQPRAIRLPVLQTYAFVEKEDAIANFRKDELFPNRTYVDNGTASPYGSNTEKIIHRVRKGETIRSISNHYGVSISDIKRWNGLKSNTVASGRRLIIYADNGGYVQRRSGTPASTSPAPSLAETQAAIAIAAAKLEAQSANESTVTASVASTSNTSPIIQYGKYKVKAGDSFYTIAKKYPGYSDDDIMRMNRMKNNQLKAGQYINVPKI